MNGGLLPPALLCLSLGLTLAFATRQIRVMGLAGLAIGSLICLAFAIPQSWSGIVFVICWLSVAVTALTVHLPKGLPAWAAVVLGLNVGVWCSAIVSLHAAHTELIIALPVAAICFPVALIAKTRFGIVPKILASWLIAVSILAASLSTIPTPGYRPDHMG